MMLDEWLTNLAWQLNQVDGLVGVMLGGSRARGDHTAASDFDIGLYYRPPLDTATLGRHARRVGGLAAEVSEPGEWGPWVDGGAWLNVDGNSVDWIYRDVNRVQTSWEHAQRGKFNFNAQIGHPLGVPDFAYAGEVALGVVLEDPSGQLGMKPAPTRRRLRTRWSSVCGKPIFCSAVFVSRCSAPTPFGSLVACSG